MSKGIQHVFVLMLENRSFDRMLGSSGITGTDAVPGIQTEIIGLIDLSLVRLAESFKTTAVSGMVQKKGLNMGRIWAGSKEGPDCSYPGLHYILP